MVVGVPLFAAGAWRAVRPYDLRGMFDFHYHVASLSAVFVALVIGILVGVGLSGRGFVDDAERKNLSRQIESLKAERDTATSLLDAVDTRQQAMQEYAEDTYPVLVPGRLEDTKVAVLSVGSVDQSVEFAVRQAVRDAGGTVVRMRALDVPLDAAALAAAIAKRPALKGYEGSDHLDDLGRDLGAELVAGGETPLWDALDGVLVDEREGPSAPSVDAVVVARPAAPQQGLTKELLGALYSGVARSGAPAVGVELGGTQPSAVPAFRRGGLSTVDTVEAPAGRLALVLLLGGAQPGNYGLEAAAGDGVLPPLTAAPATQG
jgi:hypothetical protein